jgi:hypothetical protein
MKKVIRLTESDLVKIVKRVINEESRQTGFIIDEYGYYTGEYIITDDGKRIKDGKGVVIWKDGSKYTGEWKNDGYNGYGTLTYENGSVYKGTWKDFSRDGYGTLILNNFDNGGFIDCLNNAKKYVGDFKDSWITGYGTITYNDGREYIGYFDYNELSGYGTMTWKNGAKYVGNWAGSLFNGYGTYKLPDGSISKGTWKDGKLVTPDSSNNSEKPEVSNTDCNSLKAEADKQTLYNPTNLSSGKLSIGLKNQGPLVKYVQCLLNGKNKELSLGLTDLTVDVIFGNQTKKMVRKFQEKTGGLGTDGVVDKGTFSKLA